MADEQVVNQGTPDQTPSALENAIVSSPEIKEEAKQQVQESQTETAGTTEAPEPIVQQEEGRIPYSRFKEKVDETNWYKQQVEQLIQQRQQQLNVQQPTTDPYQGMSADERLFFIKQREMAREEAMKVVQEELGQVRPIIDAGRMELAQMKVLQFRASHPDIKPNSPEEMEIAQKIQIGYSPDDAYWATMGPRGVRVAEHKVQQQLKQQIEAKKKANSETQASIPINALPKEEPLPFPKNAAERQEYLRKSRERFRASMLRNMEADERGA